MAKTDFEDFEKTNIRSEEVADILERFPTKWSGIVSMIVSVIVLIICILSYVIQYPDSIQGQITLTKQKAPVRIEANSKGRLHLLIANNVHVNSGEFLGYIENGADITDILTLDSLLKVELDKKTIINFPHLLSLGSLGTQYNDYVLSYKKYNELRVTKVFESMRTSLEIQKASAEMVQKRFQSKQDIHNLIHKSITRHFEGDSVLSEVGALSEEELEIKYNNLLSSNLTGVEYDIATSTKISEIHGLEVNIAKLEMEQEKELNNAFNTMLAMRNILADGLTQWKNKYLIISSIEGTVSYLDFLRENKSVKEGEELFSILPEKNAMIGEMYISIEGSGKVKRGQLVNIKLADYPYNEFGYFRGQVKSISKATKQITTSNNITNVYLVQVTLPKVLKTNYGKILELNSEVIGQGDIITKKRRLIERLFDNLKSYSER